MIDLNVIGAISGIAGLLIAMWAFRKPVGSRVSRIVLVTRWRINYWKKDPRTTWTDVSVAEGSALVLASLGLGYIGFGPLHGVLDSEGLGLARPVSAFLSTCLAGLYFAGSGFVAGEGLGFADRVRRLNR